MANEISKYFFITITAIVGTLFFCRAIKLISKGKILKHKVFDFPDDWGYKIAYCVCVCVLCIVGIYFKLA